MKKNFFIVCCFAVFSVLLSSCSTNVNDEGVDNINVSSKIISEIEKVNAEIAANYSQDSRGWNKWNREEKIKVVCADAVGAVAGAKAGFRIGFGIGLATGTPHLTGGGFCALGALVGGAWASWMQAPTRASVDGFQKLQGVCKLIVSDSLTVNDNALILKDENSNQKIKLANALIARTKLDEKYLRIARMHNIVLSTLDGSITLDESKVSDTTVGSLKDLVFNNKALMDSSKAIGERKQIAEYSITIDPTEKIMNLFQQIVLQCASNPDDVAFIISRYMDKIDSSSELKEEQKESLKYGLATALYSSNYWEMRYNTEIK